MRILAGDMDEKVRPLYEYLLDSSKFKLLNEGVEYDEKGKVTIDAARFVGPGNHKVELMSMASGFCTVNIFRAQGQGFAPVVVDAPALLDVETFKAVFSTLWGVRR